MHPGERPGGRTPPLGPVAFMHRASADENPTAPLSHHNFDSTHIAFGVVTAAVDHGPWVLEGSVFNGREPDENRWDVGMGVPSLRGSLGRSRGTRARQHRTLDRVRFMDPTKDHVNDGIHSSRRPATGSSRSRGKWTCSRASTSRFRSRQRILTVRPTCIGACTSTWRTVPSSIAATNRDRKKRAL
jgi:hypothetical protein